MNNFRKLSLSIAMLLFFFASCSSDDENTAVETNEIKPLTGFTKIEIGEGDLQYDGRVRSVIGMDIDNDDDGNTYLIFILNLENPEFIALSTSDGELDGNITIALLDGQLYSAENINLDQISEGVLKVTGTVTSGNGSKDIILEFDENMIGNGSSTIDINDNIAVINGTLGSVTYNQILDLNQNHPEVHTILLGEIDGSVNDEVNVQTGRLIRQAGYTTWVNSDSEIYSGGVDLFCSGVKRLIDTGAILGVHSWCCGSNGEDAFELPNNDLQHTAQINYFNEMLGSPKGEEFYFYTINAAEFDNIHIMTTAEIQKYGLATE